MPEVTLSQKQARAFAQLIYRDVHQYCVDHKEEYERFLEEESRGKDEQKSNSKTPGA